VTTQEVVLGVLLAVVVALATALLLHSSSLLRRTIYPLLIASQTVPVVVFAPILAIMFGYGIEPKLVIVALICFFPIVVNTLDGLRSVDPELPRMMRTLDADRWAIFRRVEFPSALPQLFSGARVAVTYAPIGAVFGEWSGSTDGLGFVMLQATPQLRTALVFAAIVVLTAESIALFLLVRLLERVVLEWNRR
jgi:putative hydroxymethylpyrimidine transport system permease protein